MAETIVFSVPDISCKHCEMAIKNGLKELEGIQKTDVDLDKKTVTVEYDPGKVGIPVMKQAIENQGYDVK
ncbi:MAG: heavy-metal-associated domain-containing protein [Spirochaetales bacterium]|nr:heavy-metal-associated domain-containing protein [Spirochaetales bacterium]